MKGVAVALLVAAAAFAPSPVRADPATATTVDRASDAASSDVQRAAAQVPVADPDPDPKAKSAANAAGDDPSRTLPPTDTELPAVDGRH